MASFHRHIDLDLKSRWFVKKPAVFPYPALRKAGPLLSANHAWDCMETIDPVTGAPGEEWTLIGAVQWEDQPTSVTKIRVRWHSSNIKGTVKGEYKHVPVSGGGKELHVTKEEQQELTANELALATEWYGRPVFEFCEQHLGFLVGDGECWTLAQKALVDAGRKAISQGYDPPMVSMGRVHGQCIFEWDADSRIDVIGLLDKAKPAMGDIMEMDGVRFRTERMLMGMLKEMTSVHMGKHTAVVESIQGLGSKVVVIEQNANVKRRVTPGQYELSEMVSGKVRIYRPVGQSMHSPLVVDLGAICRDY